MSALASFNLDAGALARLGVLQGTEALVHARSVLGLGWPELEDALPDGGLPRGVVEIASLPRLHGKASSSATRSCPESMRGGATSIAIAAMRALHASDAQAWCAWITPAHVDVPSLYAPALVQAGVDLERLLVVRPEPQALARTAVKVASSGACALVVIDAPHRSDLGGPKTSSKRTTPGAAPAHDAGAVVVRKLALAAEENGTTSLLLTSALAPRAVPWPVAMRLEVERRPDALSIRVTKDRRGHGSSQQVVRLFDPTTQGTFIQNVRATG